MCNSNKSKQLNAFAIAVLCGKDSSIFVAYFCALMQTKPMPQLVSTSRKLSNQLNNMFSAG